MVLGRLDPCYFAGGTIPLYPERAGAAIDKAIGAPLGLKRLEAALSISEIVEENMANAARVHAVERGKDLQARTLIAFGGAAPLHAVRLAEKLGMARVMVPAGAGVGSAFGFLRAPVAYEVVRSRYVSLDQHFDAAPVNAMFAEMRAQAEGVVRAAEPTAALIETRTADMRYRGQGHEIADALPSGTLTPGSRAILAALFEEAYRAAYGRTIPGLDVEIMNWTLHLSAACAPLPPSPPRPAERSAQPRQSRGVFSPAVFAIEKVSVYYRSDLTPGSALRGPALVAEDETTVVVPTGWSARVDALETVVIEKDEA